MTVRRRGVTTRRRYTVTIALRCVLANMRCGGADAARAEWERFWGSADEARFAFEALRDLPAHRTLGHPLGTEPGDSYESWFQRLGRHADEHDAAGRN